MRLSPTRQAARLAFVVKCMKPHRTTVLLGMVWAGIAAWYLFLNIQFVDQLRGIGFEQHSGYGASYIAFFLCLLGAAIWAMFGRKLRKAPLIIGISALAIGIVFRLLVVLVAYEAPIVHWAQLTSLAVLVLGMVSIYALSKETT